jgi:hypothetical protein
MELLKQSGQIYDSEVDEAEDVLERNALLGDFSGSEGDAEEFRLGGVLENGSGAKSGTGVRTGHFREGSV